MAIKSCYSRLNSLLVTFIISKSKIFDLSNFDKFFDTPISDIPLANFSLFALFLNNKLISDLSIIRSIKKDL